MKEKSNNKCQINNKTEKDIILFSVSLIFEQNIYKVWYYLRDLSNEFKILSIFEKIKYIKGENTWTKGNIFSNVWIGFSPFKFKCVKIIEEKYKKLIKWNIEGEIGVNIYKEILLYPITQNGKTLVKIIISHTEKEDDFIDYKSSINYYLNYENNLLIKSSSYLQKLKNNLISYESCIINVDYLKVWNLLLDINEIVKISSFFFGKKIEFSVPKIEEGVFVKFYVDKLKYIIYTKIIEIKAYKKKKERKIKLENIGIYKGFLPKESEIKLIIIDNYKIQLSLKDTFKYRINQDLFKQYDVDKKEFMKNFKKYIEKNYNYFSINKIPNINNKIA